MKRILISVAEPSGDRLGAELVRALRERGDVEFFGLAGPRLRSEGVTALARMEDVAAMGLIEVLGQLKTIHGVRNTLLKALDEKPDAVIVIDAPDLHTPLARAAKDRDILTIGYVSPQVWAWRPGRVQSISSALDQLLCLFAFEPELYPTLETHWVGHPVVDRLPARVRTDPLLFGLTPGSRRQETDRLLPIFIEAAAHIKSSVEGARFCLVSPVDNLEHPDWIDRADSVEALASARAVLTKSGTITLELAVMGVPQVVAHKVHPLTHWLGRRMIQGISHIAMPNILANAEVVPEFIQDLKPSQLADAVCSLPAQQGVDLSALGASGASKRAAEHVWAALGAA
jgi:lipid-A-disaccharide synthase